MRCPLYKQAIQRSKSTPCEIIDRIDLDNINGETYHSIEVVKGNKLTRSCIGIHVSIISEKSYEHQLNDAIEQAGRDLFERIYIYQRSSK